MKIFLLNKRVLLIKNNAVEFLNGLTTNAMDKPWSAFTDVHGRVIAVFDQAVLNEEEVLISLEKDCTDAVFAHLDRYAKLSGVKIEKKDLHVYFDCAASAPLAAGDTVIPQKKGRLIISPRVLKATISEEKFTLFRVQNGIPQQGVDFQQGEFLLNISETDHVSYIKGCFLGQEPIAKVHNRSTPSWRLMAKYEDECSDEEKAKMTSRISDPSNGRLLGFLFVSSSR